MTAGIICTVVIGLIALWQALALRCYRDAAEVWRTIAGRQREILDTVALRLDRQAVRLAGLRTALVDAEHALQQNDGEALIVALRSAIAAAAAEEVRS